ncbi:MAG: 2-oxoacid:acceptor oxidoreductase subunit alpha [Sumerlaeia bacterium]
MTTETPTAATKAPRPQHDIPRATIRFAGDSGDGMQLTGAQFTNSSAIFGNDVSTLPDFPAEIRAPAGTVYGVSGFQVNFSSDEIYTPGDEVDALVAMNPAALKVNLRDLKKGGIVIVNEDGFTDQTLKLAGYEKNPLEDSTLSNFRVHAIPITSATIRACEEVGLTGKDAQRCKNMFALGVVSWLYSRPLAPIIDYISEKFAKNETVREANIRVLKAGYFLADTEELFSNNYKVEKAKLEPGLYREIKGNQALAYGLIAASSLANKPMVYATYPITPASDILHELARHKNFGVRTVQAEDEIAAICAAIGASFGGLMGVTASSGPGIALKGEAMGLAMMLELPLIIVNVQRGGPSTGLPTKTEQSDLLQAMHGRNGESPVVVVAPRSPSDCFDVTIMACRIAFKHMVPVIILSDGYIANSAEPWKLPDVSKYEPIQIEHIREPNGPDGQFLPYKRNEDLARPWALPGTPGLTHRVGGLEKADGTGNVSYDPDNHQKMTNLRQAKVDKVADMLPEQQVFGDVENAELLLVGWGGTYGAIREANRNLVARGKKVANIHVRYLNPFPKNLGEILKRYPKILVPELNRGQLRSILRDRFLVDARGLNKVQGRPFSVIEIEEAAEKLLAE